MPRQCPECPEHLRQAHPAGSGRALGAAFGAIGVSCHLPVRRLYIHGGQKRFEQREAVVLLVLREEPA
ncbi:hypothetical protein BLAT2472_11133 [Burkholderia latens]